MPKEIALAAAVALLITVTIRPGPRAMRVIA